MNRGAVSSNSKAIGGFGSMTEASASYELPCFLSLFSSGWGNSQDLGMRQDPNKESRVLAYHGDQSAENTQCTAPEDKQDASGYSIRPLGCSPSTG